MTPPKKQPAPTTKVCGFHGPGGVVTETALRAAIAAAATTERGTWRPGGTFQKEDDPARFGDLVRYWLGGTKGHEVIRPDTLLAAQQAALDPSVKYGVLPTSTLSTAVSAFVAADQAVDTTAAALLGRWDDVDAAQVAFDAARAKVAPAEAAVDGAVTVKNDAEKAVTQAEAGVKAGTTSQAVLNQAKIDLGAATTTLVEAKAALTAAVAVRDTKKTALRTAEKNRNDAKKAFVKAKKDKDKVEAPAAALNTTLLKKVVDQLLAVPRPAGVPAIKRSFVNAAVEQAHQSRWEIAAWSAAFVTACVRGVAIAQKLEAMDGGFHRGPNVLLVATGRHTEYVIAARDQKKAGTYHAFEPETRPVQAGDIIVTDRVTEIEDRIGLKALAGSRELHGDIVIDVKTVDGTRVAETIGGNVHDTVRRRRYLLDGSDMLVVERERLFAEEKDNGAFDLFVTRPTRPTILPSSSTRRIFALLSLVQECKDVPASQELESPWGSIDRLLTDIAVVDRPSPWRVPTGNQRLMAKASEQLESPFLDEEIVAGERWGPTDASESWAEEVDASGAGEVSSGTAEAEADWEGTQNLEDVTDSGETWDPETPASWNREGEPDLEEEWKDLAPADVPDEAVAQPPYAPAIRARLEPLLDTKRAAAAATWNAARHPAKSGVDTATLLARLDRYVDRAAVERAMQASADLQGLTSDPHAVLAVVAHQFQQKIQIPPPPPTKKHPKPPDGVVDGKVGEGTLDALGFVRHRDASLNRVDALNVDFHVKGNTKAYRRVKEAYAAAASEFTALGPDVTAKNWYYLFVNPPFLGRPFLRGVHLELMRRLRLAERWLLSLPKYQGMSPVELGAALGIDEDHHGGRTTTNNSMHTLGLAVDIGYIKNPWVAGQHGNDGMPNKGRNDAFQTVTGNVARLLTGVNEAMTPLWLAGLGADPKRTTDSAFTEVQQRHARLLEYLALENDPDRLRAIIQQQTQGSNPQLVIKRGETVDASVVRWRKHIKDDRTIHLPHALGSSRKPGAGFMNLHRDLVVAMRDHGCLAWGAVDLGRNACGDMMHFDCRASGLGWTLSLQKQRTAGANHPCGTAATSPATTQSEMSVMSTSTAAAAVGAVGPLGAVGAVGELGTTGTAARTTSSSAPTPAHFLDGLLWTFPAKTLPVPIGVFCPKAVQQPNAVELLVYAHGLLSPCPPRPKKMPRDLITSPPFHLAKLVVRVGARDGARRAVPRLGRSSGAEAVVRAKKPAAQAGEARRLQRGDERGPRADRSGLRDLDALAVEPRRRRALPRVRLPRPAGRRARRPGDVAGCVRQARAGMGLRLRLHRAGGRLCGLAGREAGARDRRVLPAGQQYRRGRQEVRGRRGEERRTAPGDAGRGGPLCRARTAVPRSAEAAHGFGDPRDRLRAGRRRDVHRRRGAALHAGGSRRRRGARGQGLRHRGLRHRGPRGRG